MKLQKRLWHKCFPVDFAKFSRIPFFIEHLRWLLLYTFKSVTNTWGRHFKTDAKISLKPRLLLYFKLLKAISSLLSCRIFS